MCTFSIFSLNFDADANVNYEKQHTKNVRVLVGKGSTTEHKYIRKLRIDSTWMIHQTNPKHWRNSTLEYEYTHSLYKRNLQKYHKFSLHIASEREKQRRKNLVWYTCHAWWSPVMLSVLILLDFRRLECGNSFYRQCFTQFWPFRFLIAG